MLIKVLFHSFLQRSQSDDFCSVDYLYLILLIYSILCQEFLFMCIVTLAIQPALVDGRIMFYHAVLMALTYKILVIVN